MREFSCPLLVFEWGVGHLCAPGRVLMCKCRSVQEWSLTKCKRLHRGHKHASTLGPGFVHIVHIVCAHCAFYFHACAFQRIFIDGQLIVLHFVSLFVCPQAQQTPRFGTAAVGSTYPGHSGAAAQQHGNIWPLSMPHQTLKERSKKTPLLCLLNKEWEITHEG